jgi:hypothetical protein
MLLLGTTGASGFKGADFTKFIDAYQRLSSCTEAEPVAKNIIAFFPCYRRERTQQMIKMINRYLREISMQSIEEQ